MIDRPSSASSTNERCARSSQSWNVGFTPWILVASNDYAWLVAVDQQEMLVWGFVSEKPFAYFRIRLPRLG